MARIHRGRLKTKRRQSNLMSNEPKDIRSELDTLFGLVSDIEQAQVDLRELQEGIAGTVHMSTATTIADATQTVVTFEGISQGETRGIWDPANPTRLLFPTYGLYVLGVHTQWDNIGVPIRVHASLLKNGLAASLGSDSKDYTGNSTPVQTYVTMRELDAGDYMELWVTQVSGGPHDLLNVNMWYHYLGATADLSVSGPLGGLR